jgi:hypothetical protein
MRPGTRAGAEEEKVAWEAAAEVVPRRKAPFPRGRELAYELARELASCELSQNPAKQLL